MDSKNGVRKLTVNISKNPTVIMPRQLLFESRILNDFKYPNYDMLLPNVYFPQPPSFIYVTNTLLCHFVVKYNRFVYDCQCKGGERRMEKERMQEQEEPGEKREIQ